MQCGRLKRSARETHPFLPLKENSPCDLNPLFNPRVALDGVSVIATTTAGEDDELWFSHTGSFACVIQLLASNSSQGLVRGVPCILVVLSSSKSLK